ncbi:MAG: type V CRISPR-associated protein Cas4 [Flavobacteriaceae bacterium]|nr:type V CRISPR-associated protein Cas4 [Flavobacteriaceae bacterium]MDZ4148152.1 type V CRISPR-associated protein Cas4 [Flavobacteriaceae bacterium]
METFLQITYLNDFVFCPYSIYLHQVFDNNSEDTYSSKPQQKGKLAHHSIDTFETPNREKSAVLRGIYVISNRLGVYGKIDTLYVKQQKLVESKFKITTLYRGYYYQLWAQYLALTEMGYEVNELFFHSIKDKKNYKIEIPKDADITELKNHIRKIARFDFEAEINVNPVKCKHCIYASLCDKTNIDHVYA